MKVLLLFDETSVNKSLAEPNLLKNILSDKKVEYDTAILEDLVFNLWDKPSVIDSFSGKDISEFDLVYFRRWMNNPSIAMSAAIYLNEKKVKFFDSEVLGVGSINKLSQTLRLWSVGLNMPKTIICCGSKKSVSHCKQFILENRILDDFKLIVKSASGTRGSDNYLVSNITELSKILDKKDIYLIQNFIENDGDYRLFVTGDDVELIIKRERTAGHLNNTSKGARSRIVTNSEISNQVINDSVKASKLMHREISGVDVLISKKNKHFILEINRSPQIENSSFTEEKNLSLNRFFKRIMNEKK